MASIITSIPNVLSNGTLADAGPVEANFVAIQTQANANGVDITSNQSIGGAKTWTSLNTFSGGITISSGGLTLSGGLTVSSGATSVQSLTSATGMTVTTGGLTVSAGAISAAGGISSTGVSGVAAIGASIDGQSANGGPFALYGRTTSVSTGDCWIGCDSVGSWGFRLGAVRALPNYVTFVNQSGVACGLTAGASAFGGTVSINAGGLVVNGASAFNTSLASPTVASSDNSTNVATTANVENKTFGYTATQHTRASPALGVAYTPSTTKPAIVTVAATLGTGSQYLSVACGGATFYSPQTPGLASQVTSLTFPCPANTSYTISVSAGAVTFAQVNEFY